MGESMRNTQRKPECQSWVVYLITIHGKLSGRNAVCEQSEWEAMELSRPGYHTLVQSGIADENAAEKLARGTSGDTKSRFLRQ